MNESAGWRGRRKGGREGEAIQQRLGIAIQKEFKLKMEKLIHKGVKRKLNWEKSICNEWNTIMNNGCI